MPELAALPAGVPRRRGLPWGRFLVVILLVLADQWSKHEIFVWLEEGGRRAATAELRIAAVPADGETVTVGSRTFVFRAALGDGEDEVLAGDSPPDAAAHLAAALEHGEGAGERYRSARRHIGVGGAADGDTVHLRARIPGEGGNTIPLAETLTAAGSELSASTLGGGRDEVVERDLHGHGRVVLFTRHLAIMTSENAGAAFGRFADWPHALVVGRILAVCVLVWLLARAGWNHPVTLVAMVLVLSGAVGNLLDNLLFGIERAEHPYRLVRDFIDVWFVSEAWGWDWHFPTFNVADSCISVGAVGWVLAGLFHRQPVEDEAGGDPPAPTP